MTDLREAQALLGAVWATPTDSTPQDFGDADSEALAAVTLGLADVSSRGTLKVFGADAGPFLHRMLSANVAALEIGQGTRAELLTGRGTLVADLRAYRRSDSYWLDLEPGLISEVGPYLADTILSDDVSLEDISQDYTHLRLFGSLAVALLGGGDGAALDRYQYFTGTLGAGDLGTLDCFLDRWGNLPVVDLYGRPESSGSVWKQLHAAGARCMGSRAMEFLRVDAGEPRQGNELTADILPLESGLAADVLSDTKGCYPGQEVVVRILHRGHVNRGLYRVRFEGAVAPRLGSGVTADGKTVIGKITSVAVAKDQVIGLAILRNEFGLNGQRLAVVGGDASTCAVVRNEPPL